MDKKKTVAAVVLLIVIVGAIVLITKRFSGNSAQTPVQGLASMSVNLIDSKTYEIMTKTQAEWNQLGMGPNGAYKNPTTGEYTMCSPMTCASCGKKIPDLWPAGRAGKAARAKAVCPLCGNNPFTGQPNPQ